VAILPVKPFARAKQRLAAQLSAGDRHALVVAMFSDVLVALSRCEAIDRVLVVSDDRRAQQLAAGYGAAVTTDGQPSHSAATLRGLEEVAAEGAQRAVLVPGDCPLLDPGELSGLVRRLRELQTAAAGEHGVALIVPDRHGTGTNALAFDLPAVIAPAFGPGSRDRHANAAAAAGARYELAEIPTLALDVDTPEDLRALELALVARHGGAAHTRGMLAQFARSAHRR
jgi:2-phospho-L-lactate guanylyltransferase